MEKRKEKGKQFYCAYIVVLYANIVFDTRFMIMFLGSKEPHCFVVIQNNWAKFNELLLYYY